MPRRRRPDGPAGAPATASVIDVPAAATDHAGTPVTRRRGRLPLSAQRRREIILVLLLVLCYGFFRQNWSWNEGSRYALVLALVEQHTTHIDAHQDLTGDKAFFAGHYYSDKLPGSAYLGVPPYLLLRLLDALGGGRPDADQGIATLAFAVSGLPTVLLVLALCFVLRSMVGEWWALVLSLGYGLGSMAFPFATMYFGHAASTSFLFVAFALLWRSEADSPMWRLLLAGFLLGWSVLIEVPAAMGAAALLVYSLPRGRRVLMLIIAGALPPAALLLGYNLVSFGNPLSFGYNHLPTGEFARGMSQGIFGVTRPKLSVLNDLMLGPRGLLRQSPWLALAPLGLLAAKSRRYRGEVALCAAICGGFLVFNAGYYLPFGGRTPGPRFLSQALPFAVVLVALAPRAFRSLIGLQIVYSILVFFVATATLPEVPEAVNDPLGEQWLPQLAAHDLATTTAWLRWGLHGLQPLFVLGSALLIAALALWATTRVGGAARRGAGMGIAALAILVAGFGTPLNLSWHPALVAGSAPRQARVTILDAGVTPVIWDGRQVSVQPWIQVENLGGAPARTTDVWSIYSASGGRVFQAGHGDVQWLPWERKRIFVEWSTKDVTPGRYRVSVAIMSVDQQTTLSSVQNAGSFQVYH